MSDDQHVDAFSYKYIDTKSYVADEWRKIDKFLDKMKKLQIWQ